MSTPIFYQNEFSDWEAFLEFCRKLNKHKGLWIYRGQRNDWELETRLERACNEFDLLNDAAQIEAQLIREFRRRYKGADRDLVDKDTLYCLALMQHHGAPTRLLDCTYSPFVAAYFALETKPKEERSEPSIVYCFNGKWLYREAVNEDCKNLILERSRDDQIRREDRYFMELYMSESPKKFVSAENAFNLNDSTFADKIVPQNWVNLLKT